MALVHFSDVGLRYAGGEEILRDVDLTLEAGSFHYLTGDSGSGKTSLMRLLAMLERPSRGRIAFLGHDLATVARDDMPDLRRQIGVVFQDFRLLTHLSAFDNVALPLRVAGAEESSIRRNVGELLNWVGLGAKARARPATLSGGEQQRVAIARAVINQPKLLLADEPTSSIDDASAARLMMLFEELNRHGTTVVVATHDEGMVRRFPHPTLRLDNGILRGLPARAAA